MATAAKFVITEELGGILLATCMRCGRVIAVKHSRKELESLAAQHLCPECVSPARPPARKPRWFRGIAWTSFGG